MSILKKTGLISTLVTLLMVVMILAPTTIFAAQPTVNLGSTQTFAVLAGSTITNTGSTIISGDVGGDVGLSPGTVFTGQADVTISGAVHLADAVAVAAKNDLVTAYDDANGRTPTTRIPSELGGTTLTPGVYDSADGTFQITGKLTLDAKGDPDGVFIFKSASTLITASNSSVNLINSARFCRTFWAVGSSATLGTNSNFVGHILAMTSITANTGAMVQGQLLARNGAVTLDNNTITNGICETPVPVPTPVPTPVPVPIPTPVPVPVPTPVPVPVPVPVPTPVPTTATLHVIKHVINDNAGTAVAADFKLHVKNSGNDVITSPAPGSEAPGTSYTLAAGTYAISEDAFKGYTASYSGDSDASGNITLSPGDNKTITITNDDILVPAPVIDNGSDVTPVVSSPTTTVTGGKLPATSSHLYELLLMGVTLTLLGAVGFIARKRYE
jgi:hypothetical protein